MLRCGYFLIFSIPLWNVREDLLLLLLAYSFISSPKGFYLGYGKNHLKIQHSQEIKMVYLYTFKFLDDQHLFIKR
jgi:hypothetical protein